MTSLTFPAFVCVLFGHAAVASDWPQWRGPGRDGHVPDAISVPSNLPSEPKILWRVKVGDGLASPIVADEKVFHLDNHEGRETLHALDSKTGNELWSASIDEAFKDSQSVAGPRCTPVFDSGRVYAQSCRGELQCRASRDGKLVWRVNYVTNFGAVFIGEKGAAQGAARHGYNGSPVIDGEGLLALAGGTNGSGIVCLDKTSGKVLWKSQDDPAAYAPLIVATIGGRLQVIAFTCAGLLGVDRRDGTLLWRVPLTTTFSRHVTTPTVAGDIVMVSSHEFGLVGVRVGQQDGKFTATRLWTSKEAAINFSSPVVVGAHLYGIGPDKNLICVEARTGKLEWSKPGYSVSDAGKAHASLLVMRKNLLVLTDGGQLVMLPAVPALTRELGRAQVCGRNWCNPAWSDGTLFVRDSRDLLAVRLLP
ncbi:MAG: outer membrane protein assembly factor BamB [Verrucomicrobiota bacterium]|jgi:outer membrane protein assembly factor BamB